MCATFHEFCLDLLSNRWVFDLDGQQAWARDLTQLCIQSAYLTDYSAFDL